MTLSTNSSRSCGTRSLEGTVFALQEEVSMFCPNCGAEYVEGIVECADCRVKLVAEPPHPGAGKPIEYEEILSTFNQGDIALIKSILDNEKVDYFFRGEYFNLLDPLIQPARLFVKRGHCERAKKVMEGLNVSFLGLSGERTS